MNQAIEANIVGPHLPEEVDRVEQFLVEFRAVQQRIHDLNQVLGFFKLNIRKGADAVVFGTCLC